uniref:MAT 1.1.1 n=1 Tax=Fusarium azukiicola TaxID=1174670 RepID=A0A075MG19_9HYPO|nr:MAT 1.1.1 [Fusarium azukiicola]
MAQNTLAQSLAGVSVNDLLAALPHDTLRGVATQLHHDSTPAHEAIESPNASGIQDASTERAKRPLNAFMAFRTYYLKMFPDIQQKTVSGFLTTLWNQEAQRNKWALVAKVYSFVRDHLGKGKVNLAAFLAVCCPTMKMIDPADYLETLGWVVQEDEQGGLTIGRAATFTPVHSEATEAADGSPTSEYELLVTLVESGYLPEHGPGLVQLMSQNNNGIMTMGRAPNPHKSDFINAVAQNPYQAARQLLGSEYDHAYFQRMGAHAWDVEDLNTFTYIPIPIPFPPNPAERYPFYDDERPGVPTSIPFQDKLTPKERLYEQHINMVAGAYAMDNSYMVDYLAEIHANTGGYDTWEGLQ